MTKILFVCTGNIFRSLSAEYCCKDFVSKNLIADIEISSAGIIANPQPILPVLKEQLLSRGIDPSPHIQRKLTQEIINQNDLIVAMAKNHQYAIWDTFGIHAPLFNEICYDKDTSVDDICEKEWYGTKEFEEDVYAIQTAKYIHDSMELFIANYKNFL